MTHSIARFHLKLDQNYPEETWEKIEDVIAEALFAYGVRGTLDNSITQNTVTLKDGEIQV